MKFGESHGNRQGPGLKTGSCPEGLKCTHTTDLGTSLSQSPTKSGSYQDVDNLLRVQALYRDTVNFHQFVPSVQQT